MEAVRMVLMGQLPADGPSATRTSKQAQLWAEDGFLQSPRPVQMGSLTCQVAMLALGGSITRALISGHSAPALS